MGLNVYFCDVCGVRVTDVDLRSGHGMLRDQDVICATCLEMGHGKEWLSARGGEAAALNAGVAQGPRPGNAHLLDHARDRAATLEDRPNFEDDEGSDTGIAHEPVQRQVIIPEEPQIRQLDHEDTGLVDSIPADFSGAAAGFAALSQTPARHESDDAHGDVEEDASSEVDPVLLNATPPMEIRTQEEHQASPFSAPAADDDESSALINVNKSSRPARSAPSSSGKKGRSDSARKSANRVESSSSRLAASSSNVKKSSSNSTGSSSKSGSGKISKAKTSRSGRRTATGMPAPLKIAMITVPLIIAIAVIVVLTRGSGSSNKPNANYMIDQKAQISKNFIEAQRLVNDAWVSKDVAQMKSADMRWKQFMQEWDQFSGNAKKLSNWTDDNCSDYWESLKAPDVYNRTRLLRDEIAKQTKH